jgi:beta-phosphoglucomutase-like phosphatase (HAD superfamily)
LPGAETSRHLAKILRETNPEGFQSALKSALAKGLVGDSLDTVGAAITQLRQETFAFYLQMSSLKSSGCSSDVRTLVVNSPSQTQAVQTARRLDVLKDVKVPTYPHVVPLLKMFSEHNIRQGIATSSGAFFAQGLLKALQLDNYFNAIVSADCVPQGHHKPEARPWQLLHERLTGSTITTAKGTPLSDMLFIENSAGGGLSSLRAGYGPVFIVADNIPATVGKLQAKIQAYQGDSERRIHGQAIFIDHLGSLLCPKTV